jgi:hypothetical protein
MCRTGYVCLGVTTSVGFCFPNCMSNPGAICGPYRCNTGTGACDYVDCTSASQCSTGSTCVGVDCECTASTNCGSGRRCYPRSGSVPGYCGCSTNAGCSADETCDTSTGECF